MTVAQKKKYLLEKENYGVDDLVILVEVLRSEEGCPWDREQTHKSIRRDFIEASPLKSTIHSTCFIWSPFPSPRPLMQPLDLGLFSPLPTNTSSPKAQCYKQGSV